MRETVWFFSFFSFFVLVACDSIAIVSCDKWAETIENESKNKLQEDKEKNQREKTQITNKSFRVAN